MDLKSAGIFEIDSGMDSELMTEEKTEKTKE